MRYPNGTTGLVLVFACCFVAAGLPAQEGTSASASGGRSANEVMLAFLGVEESDLFFGRLPEEVEEVFLVPPEGRIVGSLVREENWTALVDLDLRGREVVAWLEATYEASGWTSTTRHRERGGFERSRSSRPNQFCRDGRTVSVSIDEHSDGSRLRYRHHELPGGMSCADLQDSSGPSEGFTFPSLIAPDGAEQRGSMSCSGGRGDEAIGTGLVTDLSAIEIADHYSPQLAAAGWLPVASCWDGPVAVQVWEIEGDSEEPLRGLLLVNEFSGVSEVFLSAARQSLY